MTPTLAAIRIGSITGENGGAQATSSDNGVATEQISPRRMKTTGLLTIDEAARYLSVSKSSLRRWTRLETLACVRVGARRERRFRREDLDRFLDPNTPRTTPAPEAAPTLRPADPLLALDAAALGGRAAPCLPALPRPR